MPARCLGTPTEGALRKVTQGQSTGLRVPGLPPTPLPTEEAWARFFFFFQLHCVGCRILVPQQGITPMPFALKGERFNHWTAREVSSACLGLCLLI